MVKKEKDSTTEQKILDAARKVFITKGMDGARMQDIADEAGINKAMVHYYFRNKEQLFEMIFKDAFSRFVPKLNQLFESEMPLFEKIEAFTGNYIEMAIQNPYLPMFVLNEMNKQPELFFQKMWGGHPPKIEKFVQQVEKEVKKGNIRSISPSHLIIHMFSLCVFPFVGKPMIKMVMGLDELQYRNLLLLRKKEVAKFIIESIRK